MPLSRRDVQSLIDRALREDVGSGDLTTKAVLPPQATIRARILANQSGILAGVEVCRWVFEARHRGIRCTVHRRDGQSVRRGQAIITLDGPARGIFEAERTALNVLGHLSGIATLTHQFVQRIRPARAAIMDTRKTLPGLRLLEKYAVRMGGGQNHRMRLDDAVLIKTNHLNALRRTHRGSRIVDRQTSIQEAVLKAKRRHPRVFIEIEVINLVELKVALKAKPHAILLDNWAIPAIRRAVQLRNDSRFTIHDSLRLEVSGGVSLGNVRAIAATGVDRISIGRLTHSAPSLDLALRVV